MTRQQRRLVKRERRVVATVHALGAKVALGHGRGLRLGHIIGFVHHGFGDSAAPTPEARVEWRDGLSTVIRLDALRAPTRKEWRTR
jgi:hypothetical protein